MWLDLGGKCMLSIIFKPVEEHNLQVGDVFDFYRCFCLLKRIASVGHIACNGITAGELRTGQNSAIDTNLWPYSHLCSRQCLVFLDIVGSKICKNCSKLQTTLVVATKRKLELTPVTRAKRAMISSKIRLDYLTPKTRKKRLHVATQQRLLQKKNVTKLTEKLAMHDITIAEDQSKSMTEVVNVINEEFATDLNAVIDNKTANIQEKNLLREVWQRDLNRRQVKDKKAFLHDQSINKSGFKGNRWSAITIRLALAVYSRSPAAYKALCKFNILHLPSTWAVKDKLREYVHKPGVNEEYLMVQKQRYKEFCDDKEKQGAKRPLSEGALIFDEVKIIDKLVWNSKSETFVGVAMSKEDCSQIRDIFAKSDEHHEPQAAQYVLQFLWRDLSADFDLVGPYYTASQHLNQQFLMGCLMETMRFLHAYGFAVTCLVCDGAATNLSLIKTTLGIKGLVLSNYII